MKIRMNRIKKNRRKISRKTINKIMKNNRSNKANNRTNSNNLKVNHKLNPNDPKEAITNFYPNSNVQSIKNKIHNLKEESPN